MHSREILVGVTGGIAAYKTAALVSQLAQAGAGVPAVMTAAAERFIGVPPFPPPTARPVARKIFEEALSPLGPHIPPPKKAKPLAAPPASADFLAKGAHGAADDL